MTPCPVCNQPVTYTIGTRFDAYNAEAVVQVTPDGLAHTECMPGWCRYRCCGCTWVPVVEVSDEDRAWPRAQLKRARVRSLGNAIRVCRWRGNFWGTVDPADNPRALRACLQEQRKERLLGHWLRKVEES